MSQKSKRKAAMMTAEVVPGSSTQVAKEVAKSTQVAKEVAKSTQAAKEVTKSTQVTKEVTKSTHVAKEVTKSTQIPKEVTKSSQVTKEVTKSTQVAEEVANKPERLCSPEKKAKMSGKGDSSPSKEQSEEEMQKYLDDTFEGRRAFVTEEMPTILILKEHFPQLFKGRQMLAEFQRITGLDIDHLIQEYCVKYASTILALGRQTPGSGSLLKQAEGVRQQNLALRQYWDMVTALCLIPLLLKENLVEMVREIGAEEEVDPKGKIVPILISKGSLFNSDEFILVVEEEVVQEFEEFTIALGTLFSAYWVFNMQYPRTLNHTYNFIQKAILHLRDGTPFPSLCKQLVQRIQKACSLGKSTT